MRQIIVTKPAPGGQDLVKTLLGMGVTADRIHFWPAFCFALPKQPETVASGLQEAAAAGELIVMVSPAAARAVHEMVPNWESAPRFATVGSGTAQVIRSLWGEQVSVIGPQGSFTGSEELFALLKERGLPQSVLIARGQTGREYLKDALVEAGVAVRALTVYQRIAQKTRRLEQVTTGDLAPVVLVTSSDAVEIFRAMLSDERIFQDCLYLTIHPRIAQRLASAGCRNVKVVKSDNASLSESLMQLALG